MNDSTNPTPADQPETTPVAPTVSDVLAKAMGKAPNSKAGAGVTKRSNRNFIDPRMIWIDPTWNHRFDMGEIDVLAAQIKAEFARDPGNGGLIHDLHVKRIPAQPNTKKGWPDCVFRVTDGARRTLAVFALLAKGFEFPDGVPAKIASADVSDLDLLTRSFVANQQKQLLPAETANAFRMMRDAGYTMPQIVKETGLSHSTIAAGFALLDADSSVVDAIKSGEVGHDMAKSIAIHARGDKAKQKELIAAAKAAGKDNKAKKKVKEQIEATRRAKAAKKGRVLKMRALTDDQLSALGAKMSEVLLKQMTEFGLPGDADLTSWIKESDLEARIGFTFGVLQGLKAAAGVTVNLLPGEGA